MIFVTNSRKISNWFLCYKKKKLLLASAIVDFFSLTVVPCKLFAEHRVRFGVEGGGR